MQFEARRKRTHKVGCFVLLYDNLFSGRVIKQTSRSQDVRSGRSAEFLRKLHVSGRRNSRFSSSVWLKQLDRFILSKQ